MRPELGSDVTLYVFDSIDPLLEARLQRAIRGTIARGEPRASVSNIEFAQEGTQITATVFYEVNGIEESITIDVGSKVN
jgi:phage baseplate assembly protein W